MGLQRVGHNWATFTFSFFSQAGCLRINTPVSLPLKEKDWKYQLYWLSFLLYLLLIPSQSFLELFPKCTLLWCAKSHQSCSTFSDPIDCSLPGSSVPGILQARILEWDAISSSRASSRSGIKYGSLMSPALAGRFFTTSANWEALPPNILFSSKSLSQGDSELGRQREGSKKSF